MMSLVDVVQRVRTRARARRSRLFRTEFRLTAETRVLDLGSEDGSSIAAVLRETPVKARNVYIADINSRAVLRGEKIYGFRPVVIPETGRLPFQDGFFDIVYCSSVIEHVTILKQSVWSLRSGRDFCSQAENRQREFAQEIIRLGKAYFVQTPNRWFPIESHTWLPFAAYLPRRALLALLRLTNRVWIKKTTPDWRLLTVSDMRRMFPDAEIERERFGGMTKSIMAIRNPAT